MLTLTEKLRQAAAAYAGRVALLVREDDSLTPYTYAQVYQDCLQAAHGLCRAGVKKGDRVALLLENRLEWCLAYFGLQLAGAVAVPLDSQARPETVAYLLTQTQAKILVTSDQVGFKAYQELPSLKKIVVVGGSEPDGPKVVIWSDLLAASPGAGPLPEAASDDLAAIIYTSGTVGPPKGVRLTHRNFLANFQGIVELKIVGPQDNFLALLPLHHAFPFMATLILPLFIGAQVTFLNRLQAQLILRCLREQKVTILVATPQVLQHFAQGIRKRLDDLPLGLGALLGLLVDFSWKLRPFLGFDLARPLLGKLKNVVGPQFRYFVSGGAKLPVDLARVFNKWGFTVLEGYGLTETSPVASFNPPEAPRLGSVGRPLAGVEVKIGQPDSDGVGEILIRGDNVMAGYYRNPEATEAALRNGWFHSGDLGYLDRDGYLYVTGRAKDLMVLSSGKNLSVDEVSQHYLQASTIREILVLPDSRDEKLVAVVVPDLDHFRKTGETDIYGEVKWHLEYYSQQLEPYKRIRDFVLTNQELPKTRLGKIKAYEVAAIYQDLAGKRQQKRKSALEEGLSAVGEQVVEILQKKTGSALIALDDHLELDLGLDSLALVELLAALEEAFGIRIRDDEFLGIYTVADLIRFIEGQHPRGLEELEERELTWGQILAVPPPPDLLKRIASTEDLKSRLFTLGNSLWLKALFRLVFQLRVTGREGLGAGSYILCPNHASYLDGFLLFAAVPQSLRSRLYFLGYSNYFEVPVVRDIAKWMHVLPVNSARHLVPAMQASAHLLKQGGALGIFPEGARSLTGELRPFKKGVAILAQELGLPLVPVYIHGSHEAWKANARYPRPYPLHLVFGREFSAAELAAVGRASKPDAPTYEAIILGLRQEVLKLKNELLEALAKPVHK
jgi:long-chain acyl-CoA synthetase